MVKATDWNKQGAIAGYGAWVWAAASICVMLWLGRSSQSGTVLGASPAMQVGTVIPSWAFLATPSIYGVFVLVAAILHLKARNASKPIDTSTEISDLRAKLAEKTDAAVARDGIITGLRETIKARDTTITELQWQVGNTQNQLLLYKQKEEASERAKEYQAGLLRRAPRLIINYARDGMIEKLSFHNDGETTAEAISVGQLTWTEQRPITLNHDLPPIPSKHTHVCAFTFEKSPSHGMQLLEFIRRHTPDDAATTVTLTFRGEDEREFRQDFALKTFGDNGGTVVWNPNRVRLP